MANDESVIPHGPYCYELTGIDRSGEVPRLIQKRCPYWSSNPDQPGQMNGYCSYLQRGDWQSEGLSLLWDQVKECGVNEEDQVV